MTKKFMGISIKKLFKITLKLNLSSIFLIISLKTGLFQFYNDFIFKIRQLNRICALFQTALNLFILDRSAQFMSYLPGNTLRLA